MGKLLGLMGVSLTLSAPYLSAAYWAANHYGVAELVSPALIVWFFIFLILAVVMYGSLFIAVGAACSDIRDTQTMLWPVMLLAMLPLFVWINVAKEPTSTFATAISFFPFATPTMMIIRMAVPPGIGWWQPVLGLAVMLITTVGCVYIAGRIFRVGILMQGKGASVRDLALDRTRITRRRQKSEEFEAKPRRPPWPSASIARTHTASVPRVGSSRCASGRDPQVQYRNPRRIRPD